MSEKRFNAQFLPLLARLSWIIEDRRLVYRGVSNGLSRSLISTAAAAAGNGAHVTFRIISQRR